MTLSTPISTERTPPHSPVRAMRRPGVMFLVLLVGLVAPGAVQASDDFPVFPESIDLGLAPGETTVVSVSVGVTPFCFRPFLFDVHASDPTALFENLTGPDLNGCGGDVSSFDVEFMGDDTDQSYDLLMVDVYFPDSPPFPVATIPVHIHRVVPESGLLGMIGAGSILLGCLRRRSALRAESATGEVLHGGAPASVLRRDREQHRRT